MAANPTIYCLEQLTDYMQFERLCHDLMLLEGYPNIEPLGGFKDKGRDAVHINKDNQRITIFAYSVRGDWKAKLADDSQKISQHGHTCHKLVFITTSSPTATERDSSISKINQKYGWDLDIFGSERLRVLLETKYPNIREQHPSIFIPDFFRVEEQSNQTERKYILIDYIPTDFVLAHWLARRLTAEGYHVWCKDVNQGVTQQFPKNLDQAVKDHMFCMVALYSKTSLNDPDITAYRETILTTHIGRIDKPIIPLRIDEFSSKKLSRKIQSLKFIRFDNWAEGLRNLLIELEEISCPKLLLDGKVISARSLWSQDVLEDKIETLHSNCFVIKSIPSLIYKFESKISHFKYDLLDEYKLKWAFRKNENKFFSFFQPDQEIKESLGIVSSTTQSWEQVSEVFDIESKNLVSELIKKSLYVKCQQKGLVYCASTNLHYFPYDLLEKNKLKYKIFNKSRKKSHIQVCNHRQYKQTSQRYHYHIAPRFFVVQDLLCEFLVILKIRVYLTDMDGKPLDTKKVVSHRKDLCKNWWNSDWSRRVLAVSQFLSDDEKIIMGDDVDQQLIIEGNPICFSASVGINEEAIKQDKLSRAEFLELLDINDEEEAELQDE